MKSNAEEKTAGLEDIFEKFPLKQRDNLIPILQATQSKLGYISEDSIYKISDYLDLPPSKIYGVATFFNQFRLYPPGKYNIKVCRGTACHVNGASKLVQTLEAELKIKVGQTTKDGLFSIETVYCLGACSIAPVLEINGVFHGGVTQKLIPKIIHDLREKETSDSEKVK